jgi:hypothetical protein
MDGSAALTKRMPAVLPRILHYHVDQLVGLSAPRRRQATGGTARAADILGFDQRMRADLLGLLLADDAAWPLLREWDGQGGIFAWVVAALAAQNPAEIQAALAAAVEHEAPRSAVAAICWMQAKDQAQALVTAEEPLLRRIGIGALAGLRHRPDTLADLRLRQQRTAETERWTPAQYWGDLGAATLPAAIALVMQERIWGMQPGAHALATAMDPDGGRAAIVIPGATHGA